MFILVSHIDRHAQTYLKSYIYGPEKKKENKPTDSIVDCTQTESLSFKLKQKKTREKKAKQLTKTTTTKKKTERERDK